MPLPRRCDLEHRICRRDAVELNFGRVGSHAVEERADFKFPTPQVGAQQCRLLVVGELLQQDSLTPPAKPQLCLAAGAGVPATEDSCPWYNLLRGGQPVLDTSAGTNRGTCSREWDIQKGTIR